MDDMEKMEKIKRLQERTGLTIEEARDALEANNWDLLDAMVYLERLGMVKGPKETTYTTEEQKAEEFKQASEVYEKAGDREGAFHTIWRWCKNLIRIGCENSFCVQRNGEDVFKVPLIVLVVFAVAFFWATLILLIAGMFFKFQYSFEGKLFEGRGECVNEACEKMSDACENLKKEISE